ncbi:SufB/SufD family protein [Archaeoglobus veneficus]|uniref:SufBD protein n=1 Tax=Archaeoglobus veneficus (strain DSM 11195 / SNP6) TaxID=693661 RepID=F2KQK6_ARCVS|nr:SufD family Fe-S cluster assembly protein [Archaeoglobus veneficus]AEA47739.1 SufBD protein [Archaeoglobus veneficus SNP6]
MSERIPELEPEVKKRLESVGAELSPDERSATFLQVDQDVKFSLKWLDGVEVMGIKQAMEKYDWVKDYLWKAVKQDQDEYTRLAAEDFNGYFIRALPGKKVDIPVEACLYLRGIRKQKVHNIIIAEEGSEINIISGCASHPGVASGMHIGISEFFVKKNAKLTFTMIHSWDSGIEVRPRSAAIVEEGGVYISNYVLLSPVKLVQMYPTAYLKKDATAIFSSIILATEGSIVDAGSKAVLEGENSSADILSRTISKGGSVIARGHIVGNAANVRGHLECRGLMLSEKGAIHAIPELEARYPNVDLSHEAAIGKIAEEEIFYLMARGLTRDEATSAIIRGFMEIDIKGLPEFLKKEIDKAISLVESELAV